LSLIPRLPAPVTAKLKSSSSILKFVALYPLLSSKAFIPEFLKASTHLFTFFTIEAIFILSGYMFLSTYKALIIVLKE